MKSLFLILWLCSNSSMTDCQVYIEYAWDNPGQESQAQCKILQTFTEAKWRKAGYSFLRTECQEQEK